MNNELQISNTSYTNKSFQEAFPELLELAGKLSYKWNPAVSNESDPGVVILKEMALLIDKLNYNSDKNILETFPLSATQEPIARELFKLLGYFPKWYMSATNKISLQWDNEKEEIDADVVKAIQLQDFISVSDPDNEYVYTIITPGVLVETDGTPTVVDAIEGKINDLIINGYDTITIDLLDKDNRIYIPNYNVAENGIYIYNNTFSGGVGQYWSRVDNLATQALEQYVYEFGVDQANNQCYIQFPDDIASLIGIGLKVKYITSMGSQGTVNVGVLNQLFNSYTGEYTDVSGNKLSILLTNDNLKVANIALKTVGNDPESIDEMYRGYKKIVGTFDTLVTLRDYCNAFYRIGNKTEGNIAKCSNDFVCDRTNDIQNSYKILTESEDGLNIYDYKYNEELTEPFDLKLYALQFNDIVNDESINNNWTSTELDIAYQDTFWMMEDYKVQDITRTTEYQKLISQVYDYKLAQHDFKSLDENKIALVKNKYDIDCKIVPTSVLTDIQIDEIKMNIKRALYRKYNARRVDFGDAADYAEIQRTILESDPRIKYVIMGEMKYHTYVMYYAKDEYANLEG